MNPRIALENKLRELLTRVLHGYLEEQRASAVADYLRPRPPGLLGKRRGKSGKQKKESRHESSSSDAEEPDTGDTGTEEPQSHGFQWPP